MVRGARLFVLLMGLMACGDSPAGPDEPDDGDSHPRHDENDPPDDDGGKVDEELPSECISGDEEIEPCGGDQSGLRTRYCHDGDWEPWSECEYDVACSPGDTDFEYCGEGGERRRTCDDDGAWSSWSACSDGSDACESGASRTHICGVDGLGVETQECVKGAWERGECVVETRCEAGAREELGCGGSGTQERTCVNGSWQLSECSERECPYDGESSSESCGFNDRGYVDTTCVQGAWSHGTCEDTDSCVDGTTKSEPCGLQGGGERVLTCEYGYWSDYEECSQVCGNGELEGAEECDDGGYLGGDGCSTECLRERSRVVAKADRGWQCTSQLKPGDRGVHWFSDCGDSLLYSTTASAKLAETAWKYRSGTPEVGLSVVPGSDAPVLWGTFGQGLPWYVFDATETGSYVLELDQQHRAKSSHLLTSPAGAPTIHALESHGSGRFALVGSAYGPTSVRFEGLEMKLPQSAHAGSPNVLATRTVFMVQQQASARAGHAIFTTRVPESITFASDATRSALLLGAQPGSFITALGQTDGTNLLAIAKDEGLVTAAPFLFSGPRTLTLLDNGYVVVHGLGRGSYDSVAGELTLASDGPVTLVYNQDATLVAAHAGQFLGTSSEGLLAVLGSFTGGETTLDAGKLSEQKLLAPYGAYSNYVAFYRLSGALAEAKVVVSSTDPVATMAHTAAKTFFEGAVLVLPCEHAVWFGSATQGQRVPGAAGQTCVGRFDAGAESLWAERVTASGESSLLVRIEGDDTWLAGPIKGVGGETRPDNVSLLRVDASGELTCDEPILATSDGTLDTLVVKDGKAWLSVMLNIGYPPLFPGRPWAQTFYGYDVNPLIVVDP